MLSLLNDSERSQVGFPIEWAPDPNLFLPHTLKISSVSFLRLCAHSVIYMVPTGWCPGPRTLRGRNGINLRNGIRANDTMKEVLLQFFSSFFWVHHHHHGTTREKMVIQNSLDYCDSFWVFSQRGHLSTVGETTRQGNVRNQKVSITAGGGNPTKALSFRKNRSLWFIPGIIVTCQMV